MTWAARKVGSNQWVNKPISNRREAGRMRLIAFKVVAFKVIKDEYSPVKRHMALSLQGGVD
jgi:hypothetical protein